MTNKTKKFLINFLAKHPIKGKVLDVGSRRIHKCHIKIKDRFSDAGLEYVGLDMLPGEWVDVVGNAHDIKTIFEPESFDMVCCFDTLEHDDRFWMTVENMRWVLKKGGWMLINVPSLNKPIHYNPSDYYRFMEPVMEEVFLKGYKDCYFYVYYNEAKIPDEIYGWGQKPI